MVEYNFGTVDSVLKPKKMFNSAKDEILFKLFLLCVHAV